MLMKKVNQRKKTLMKGFVAISKQSTANYNYWSPWHSKHFGQNAKEKKKE